MRDYRPPAPHDRLEHVLPNVYFMRGSIRMGPGVRINRCMTVLVRDGELTLVNPVRLSDEGEAELRRLGTVRHVVRLGHHHEVDDWYYVEVLGATYWTLASERDGPKTRRETLSDHNAPLSGLRVFEFEHTKTPEAALLVEEPGLLITCDSVQHYAGFRRISLLARLMMPFLGFRRGTQVGPQWAKAETRKDGPSLQGDFRRLLELPFDSVVGAHGDPRLGGAKAALKEFVDWKFCRAS